MGGVGIRDRGENIVYSFSEYSASVVEINKKLF